MTYRIFVESVKIKYVGWMVDGIEPNVVIREFPTYEAAEKVQNEFQKTYPTVFYVIVNMDEVREELNV